MIKEVSGPDEIKKDNLPEGRETYDAFHQKVGAMRGKDGLFTAEARKLISERLENIPGLGRTPRDHHLVGGSTAHDQDPGLLDIPIAEIESDEHNLHTLNQEKNGIEKMSKLPDKKFGEDFYQSVIKDLGLNVEYLRQIGKLPDEYNEFDMESFVASLEE